MLSLSERVLNRTSLRKLKNGWKPHRHNVQSNYKQIFKTCHSVIIIVVIVRVCESLCWKKNKTLQGVLLVENDLQSGNSISASSHLSAVHDFTGTHGVLFLTYLCSFISCCNNNKHFIQSFIITLTSSSSSS